MSDALRLPPRPNLQQYKKLARDLQEACNSSDPGAVRQWAERWVETLSRLQGTASSTTLRRGEREAEHIEQRWNKLREATEHVARCTLARTQLFIAREHGFTSWPKFARHIQELRHTNSPVSASGIRPRWLTAKADSSRNSPRQWHSASIVWPPVIVNRLAPLARSA